MRIKILLGLLPVIFVHFAGLCQEKLSPDQVYDSAYVLIDQQNYTEAIEQLKLFIEEEQKSDDPDLDKVSGSLNDIGTCYHKLKDFQEAIRWYNQALTVDREMGSIVNISTRYSNIGFAYRKLGIWDSALIYYNRALTLDMEIGEGASIAKTLNNLGTLYHQMAKYDSTIHYFQRSLEIKKNIGDSSGVAVTLNNIGLVYQDWQKYDRAIEYFNEALHIDSLLGFSQNFINRLNSIGASYHLKGDFDRAIEYFSKALQLSLKSNNEDMAATLNNNLGMIYLKKKDYEQAHIYMNKALESYRNSDQKAEIATVLANLAEISFTLGDYNSALDYLSQSTGIAENLDLPDKSKNNYLMFSDIYSSMGNYSEALKYYKKHIAIKDTLYTEAIHKQITDFEIKYESEKKDKEITLLKQKEEIQALRIKKQRILRNSLFGGIALSLILAAVIFTSLSRRRRDNRIIASEKAKTDKLLLNVLPASIASDLKEKGFTEPRSYANVTVCFTDIVGFTEKSSTMEPKSLIEELNTIFTAFDAIIEKNSCERIKTIGDSYMALCGLPEPDHNHAENIIRTAVEMVQYVEKKNLESDLEWQIRVGIHSGDVIAGVVGVKKYIYDVFGDTINTASRMENASHPMRINVSESTYQLVRDKFKFEEREEAPVKGKGMMKMYFIKV
ncbi:MAG: adenylate/guanylate cyclase domain-containing protein [Bacteroidales bacterium]|nr:adenylate/guanylate cyclase domain-containing protein [Bacteroidales bacterium]